MFASAWQQHQAQQERGLSRPFIIGVVVLLLFLTTSEFGSNNSNGQGTPVSLGKDGNPINKLKDEVREKIMYELSITNEKLEKENRALMQQALLLRSLLRQCRSRSTNASISMDDVAREVQSLQQQLHAREAKPGLRANAGQGAASKSRRSSEQGSGGGGSDGSKSAGSSSSSSTSGSYRVGGGTGGADGGLQQQQGLGTKRMAIEVDASNASSVLGHTGTAPRASAGTGGT